MAPASFFRSVVDESQFWLPTYREACSGGGADGCLGFDSSW
jgi:hypothetical protein